MPVGQIQRIDQERGVAYIVQEGKTYAAPLSEVESKARVPSARVRFDLVRKKGVESAAEVRLREGTRANRRHRRFGDLTGAARPGAKVQTAASRNYGIDVTTQPIRVASTWLKAQSAQDFAGAISLYLPDATIHAGADSFVGHRRIRAELEKLSVTAADAGSARVSGVDNYVRAEAGDQIIYFSIVRGSIAEQWINIAPDHLSDDDDDDDDEPILVVRRGVVPTEAIEHATEKINHLVERSGKRLVSARVKLSMAENPNYDRPATAEASIEFDHLLVRAGASANSFDEAIDRMAKRLEVRIEHQHDRQRHQPAGLEPPPGSWRHGNLQRPNAAFFDRPVDEREIVRHKSFAPGEMTPDEATLDMALLDYDFFLFVEVDSGKDALLVQDNDGALVLNRMDGKTIELDSTANRIDVSTIPAPQLEVSQAIDLLDASGDQLQFFINRQTERGNVVYRRLDGHYGLITPSDEES